MTEDLAAKAAPAVERAAEAFIQWTILPAAIRGSGTV
jgi:hypothetical protein